MTQWRPGRRRWVPVSAARARRELLATVVGLLVVAALAVAASGGPSGWSGSPPAVDTAPAGGPVVELPRRSVPPGQRLTVRGAGFADTQVTLELDGVAVRSPRTLGGTFDVDLTVPTTLLPGEHLLTARWPGGVLSVRFVVSTEWRTAGFDPGGSGFNPYENVLSPRTVGALRTRWAAAMGPREEVDAEPVEVNGALYVPLGVWRQGTRVALLRAYDAGTGAERWTARLGEGGATQPVTVADGLVVVADGAGEGVVAVDASTGRVRWRAAGGRDVAVVNGVVYTVAEEVAALDLATGRTRWSRDLDGGVSLAVGAGAVVVADAEGGVQAFEAGSGRRRWAVPTGTAGTRVTVADGRVWFAAQGRLWAVSAWTGRLVWSADAPPGDPFVRNAVAVAGGRVYAFGERSLHAVDAATGSRLWSGELGGHGGQPAVANGVVYAQGDGLVALDAATGSVLARLATGALAGSTGSPAVTDGRVYVVGRTISVLAP